MVKRFWNFHGFNWKALLCYLPVACRRRASCVFNIETHQKFHLVLIFKVKNEQLDLNAVYSRGDRFAKISYTIFHILDHCWCTECIIFVYQYLYFGILETDATRYIITYCRNVHHGTVW